MDQAKEIMNKITMKAQSAKELVEGLKLYLVHGESMSFALVDIKEGTVLPEHAHPHEQIHYLMEGELEFTLNGQATVLLPGDALIIPGNVSHAARALRDCRGLDIFSPVREDYR